MIKTTFQMLPDGPEHERLEVFVEIGKEEARAVPRLEVRFFEVWVPKGLVLLNPSGEAYPKKRLEFDATLLPGQVWSFSGAFAHTRLALAHHRLGYVLARRIKHCIEDALILSYPLAKFTGFVQSFDVRVDVPKDVVHFEQFRRSILLRNQNL